MEKSSTILVNSFVSSGKMAKMNRTNTISIFHIRLPQHYQIKLDNIHKRRLRKRHVSETTIETSSTQT